MGGTLYWPSVMRLCTGNSSLELDELGLDCFGIIEGGGDREGYSTVCGYFLPLRVLEYCCHSFRFCTSRRKTILFSIRSLSFCSIVELAWLSNDIDLTSYAMGSAVLLKVRTWAHAYQTATSKRNLCFPVSSDSPESNCESLCTGHTIQRYWFPPTNPSDAIGTRCKYPSTYLTPLETRIAEIFPYVMRE
jgi:hypothetical protein